jgi:small redox-active disulfide protein 2
MNVKILAPGCANCRQMEALVREVAAAEHLQPEIEEVTGLRAIMAYGIMRTPDLVIDGEVKTSGRVPVEAEMAGGLQWSALMGRREQPAPPVTPSPDPR